MIIFDQTLPSGRRTFKQHEQTRGTNLMLGYKDTLDGKMKMGWVGDVGSTRHKILQLES